MSEGRKIVLTVDGEDVGMVPFVSSIISNAIVGMIKELKGCENAKKIEIEITED